ncbi:ABC transporter substrate-binding protein [Ureibacillus aquaedulcis]|uniref:ABC transporter substrate-binding protein n=1 Tax=Ureibacillus aquaedulcis TaxID=3058421 RepID=A0ABT8GT33_9BACL|nr:ABC transporter substrate-binding protein [Ureibacillus sp. BA0131]MDN4494580.1 ABC transporter substrate-binding protein [Ureibacillus sp. BA0131]
MMKLRKLSILLLISMFTLVLAACSGGETGSSSKSSNSQSTNNGEPQSGGTLTRAHIYGDPQNLDPIIRSHGTATSMITWNIFEPLVRYDAEKGEYLPGNAESWENNEEGTVYTFKLKQGVKFHNGREVKAEDFKYSLERLVNPENASPNAGNLQMVVGYEEYTSGSASELTGVKVVDDYTLEITISAPNNTFLSIMSLPYTAAVPKEVVEELGDEFGSKPVGAGPFKFSSWVRDSEIVLEKYEDYFAGAPYLDTVVYKILTDQAARDTAFSSEQIDMMILGDAQYAQYKSNTQYAELMIEVPELFIRNLRFNLEKEGPWQDVKVRQAINYAIDRETIIATVLGGKAYPAKGILPTSIKGYNEEVFSYPYDPEKAKELLKEAGYENGFTLPILTTSHSAFGVTAVEAMSGYLEEVGIKIEIEQVDMATLADRASSGDFDTMMYSNGGMTNLVEFISKYFHSDNFGATGNTGYYKNEEVDALLDKALTTTDENEMIELSRQAEAIVVEEAPMWFFNYNKAVIVHQPWVKGLQPVPTDIDYQDLRKVWIDESAKN